MKLHIIISSITIGAWLIIPDIVTGITGTEFININSIIGASSVFYILIYFLILMCIVKFAIEKVIRISIIE
jgi:hypothetical protein